MKSLKKNLYPITQWLIVFAILFSSCTPNDEIDKETKEVNQFINEYMKAFYLWEADMPNLNPDRQTDSKVYFDELLNKTYDRWSYITDNYPAFAAMLQGVELSMGYSFQLYNLNGKIIGFVEYVDEGGPADRANISRGDMIFKIDDQEITIDNYITLLSKNSYKVTFGHLNWDETITTLSPSVSLTAEVLNVNPVHLYKVINTGGIKTGYLVYNSFISNYEKELKLAFDYFKENNITELVLDLRYNGGGAVSTAILLANMLAPLSAVDKTMYTTIYNQGLTDYYKKEFPNNESYFKEKFSQTTHNLNLQRLFVLTTKGTASASEMIIYTLKPYMQVVQIGKETNGKYYTGYVLSGPKDKKTWGIIPLVSKVNNANSSINYLWGQLPKYEINDDYAHDLGDVNESMLAKALSVITGTSYATPSSLKSTVVNKAIFIPNKENLNPLKLNAYWPEPKNKQLPQIE